MDVSGAQKNQFTNRRSFSNTFIDQNNLEIEDISVLLPTLTARETYLQVALTARLEFLAYLPIVLLFVPTKNSTILCET